MSKPKIIDDLETHGEIDIAKLRHRIFNKFMDQYRDKDQERNWQARFGSSATSTIKSPSKTKDDRKL